MAANFDLPLTLISDSVHTSLTELLDPENVGVAFRIVLLSSIEAETYVISYVLPVVAAIFDLPLTLMSDSVHTRLQSCWIPKM